jgi:hypothetical protein
VLPKASLRNVVRPPDPSGKRRPHLWPALAFRITLPFIPGNSEPLANRACVQPDRPGHPFWPQSEFVAPVARAMPLGGKQVSSRQLYF